MIAVLLCCMYSNLFYYFSRISVLLMNLMTTLSIDGSSLTLMIHWLLLNLAKFWMQKC